MAWWWLVALVAVAGGALVVLGDWYQAAPEDALANATYVGRESCIECHQAEHQSFMGSHHDRSMELATDESVEGDFNDAVFERLGVTTRFFRRGKEFWVNTEGADGKNHDYQIKYTFGVDPLQQYMVEFPDGRVQVLRESWDPHKKQWFYVPPPDAPDVRLPPDDPTHWTGLAQNWNTTCAECHSTNLKKNYDLATNTYDTTFSEIDVSCEACHGPGSLHVELAHSRSLFWDRRHGYGLARLKSADATPQLDTCAQCHSRRAEIHPNFRPGQPFLDYFNPSLLHEGLYHADGQILDEVFEHGSFLQSRMHREGIRCSDCHDPHSLELKFKGNALCAQCHVPAKYDTPAHHHHVMGTPGASCVECHMPESYYMVVDPRRDHSIRVPRPDLTVELGTPNACNRCHTKAEESAEWAAAKVIEWYGTKRPDDPHWAHAIAGGRKMDPASVPTIIETIERHNTPAIVKATLCELLGQFATPEAEKTLVECLVSPDAMVRQAAVTAVPITEPKHVNSRLLVMLDDPVRTVRIAAAQRLLELPPQAFPKGIPPALSAVVEEFKEQLHMTDERAASHIQLSQLAMWSGNVALAIQELDTAMRLESYLTGTRSELAQLLSATPGNEERVRTLREEEAELLKRDIELLPQSGEVRYRLGMVHYLLDDLDESEKRLTEACELEPQNFMFWLGLAYLQQEQYNRGEDGAFDRALVTLKKLKELDRDRDDADRILRELVQVRTEREKKPAADASKDE